MCHPGVMIRSTLLIFTILFPGIFTRYDFYLVDRSGERTVGEGLLMYNGGTVCDDHFSNTSADIICQLMGYKTISSWKHGKHFGSIQDTYPIRLDDIKCSGDVLPTCTYSNTHNCHHNEDVFLTCTWYAWLNFCPPGNYIENASTCKLCPENTYKPTNQKGSSSLCFPCPKNSTAKPGSTICSCASGMFWNLEAGYCEACQRNYYSETGSTACSKCPRYSVSKEGAADCLKCQDGYEWSDYTCSKCPHGHVSNGVVCNRCQDGSTPSESGTFCEKNSHARHEMLGILIGCLVALIVIIAMLIVMLIVQQRTPQGPGQGRVAVQDTPTPSSTGTEPQVQPDVPEDRDRDETSNLRICRNRNVQSDALEDRETAPLPYKPN